MCGEGEEQGAQWMEKVCSRNNSPVLFSHFLDLGIYHLKYSPVKCRNSIAKRKLTFVIIIAADWCL